LNQSLFSAKSNGRVFIPGIPEADTEGNQIDAAQRIAVELFIANLLPNLNQESPGSGLWELGVISSTRLYPDNLPPDWAGSFSPVVNISLSPIIYTLRSRISKVVGAF
jgi:hypothetical protein